MPRGSRALSMSPAGPLSIPLKCVPSLRKPFPSKAFVVRPDQAFVLGGAMQKGGYGSRQVLAGAAGFPAYACGGIAGNPAG